MPTTHPPKCEYNTFINFADCTLRVKDVEDKLSSLDPQKGTGPDGIPPIVLRHCSSLLAPQLTVLFNNLLQSGIFPDGLKKCYVVPIHKTSSLSDIRNYRPIVIQPALGKVFEGLVLDQLSYAFKNIIVPEQHGFCKGRSSATNLLLYQSFIFSAFSKGLQVDSVYIDCSKAFDRISHDYLLAKLKGYGICGSLLAWFHSYLKDRTLLVKFMNATSRPFSAASGVPQGSLMGPFLFNIFINDITSELGVRSLVFADDLKIFHTVRSLADCELLQTALLRIQEWCSGNCMSVNAAKCAILSFSRTTEPVIYNYKIGESYLLRKSDVRDLGVTFSSSLNFDLHINDICCRALRNLNFIIRASKNGLSIVALKTLYLALVRSVLEYCSVVWSPYLVGQVDRVESIQRRFIRVIGTKLGFGFWDVPVERLAIELGLPRLSTRRNLADAVFLRRILCGHIDCPDLLGMVNLRASRSTRSSFMFSVQSHRARYLMQAPIPRLHRLGNSLSSDFDFFCDSESRLKNLVYGNIV